MNSIYYDQVATLGIQATLVSLLLLVLFRLRTRFGLSLLFITLGAFQQMQMMLALSFYVELAPGLLVSPGSVVLFTSSLFAVLLIYIREDASEARCLDVDHFKTFNDTHGHPEGDRVLTFIGTTLTRSLRAADMPCRYGGEEFILILPDSDRPFARLTAERIRKNLQESWGDLHPRPPGPCVTVTIGAAFFPQEAATGPALIRLADERLYLGKRAGRDCIVSEGSPREVGLESPH